MHTYIITVANQKGGVGKTTLAMQMAGTLGRQGKSVLVVDADPQNTATRWAASADDDAPFPASVVNLSAAGSKIHKEIQKFVGKYHFIFIDCPPSMDSPVSQSALVISDMALIPLTPSPADFWATTGIKNLLDMVEPINPSLKKMIVLNNSQHRTNLAKDVIDALEDMNIPIAEHMLSPRTAYKKSSLFGQTVHHLGKEAIKSIEEVDELTEEIMLILTGKLKRQYVWGNPWIMHHLVHHHNFALAA